MERDHDEKNDIVRARKSPWIETYQTCRIIYLILVRARKSPWIETHQWRKTHTGHLSGLVRARGLKRIRVRSRGFVFRQGS